jgi:hypothetical protein
MVKGLDRFREHFRAFADRYVIIGGTACDLALTDAGPAFRATRDIDMVLCLEAIDAAFGEALWAFVRNGRYASLEAPSDERKLYRFTRPGTDGYPVMLELFSRVPHVLGAQIEGHLTPIPFDDDVHSLSAILLDSDYDAWAHGGRTVIDGLPVVRPEHLIPLKARAWLDLTECATSGLHVDSRNIRKHRNDVFRLYAIVDPEYRVTPPDSIRSDMQRFIEKVQDEQIDLGAMGLGRTPLRSVLEALRHRYCASTA